MIHTVILRLPLLGQLVAIMHFETTYSPNQLIFGTSVNLPSVLNNQMSALESFNKSDIGTMNLDVMHKARANFIKAESSERN